MRNSRIFFYVALSAIVLISVFVLVGHRAKNKQSGMSSALIANDSNPATNHVSKNSNAQTSPGKIISDVTTSSNRIVVAEKDGVQKTAHIPPTLAHALTDEQILETLFSNQTNVPTHKKSGQPLNKHLVFYGLTLDDQTNAVSGAMVTGNVMVWDEQNPSRQVPVETTSDGEGRFQFDMDNGQLIMINVGKGTNYISPPPEWFQYGPVGDRPIYHPDPNNPAVFILTKKQLEPLIELRKGMTAPNTGEPIRIDLTTGAIVPTGGDLIVSITCPEPFKAQVHIPWKLVLQATDGGLATISDGQLDHMLQYDFEAPISGYGEIVIDHPPNDPNWDTQYDSILYLKSRNGQIYGKLSFGMDVRWDERGVPFSFHSFVNPNGSRNLQSVSQ